MRSLLRDAAVLDARGERASSCVLIEAGRIAAVGGPGDFVGAVVDEEVELGGATLTPGLIDLHGHGGGGFSFDDGATDPAAFAAALAVHRAHGTTRSVISLVANPVQELRASLAAISDLCASDPLVLGAHLEGPLLSPGNCGAHNPAFLSAPDGAVLDALLEAGGAALRQVTVAPELPGALDAIARLSGAGVAVALGHTVADYATTRAGFDAGARLLTHAFNAMPGIHHRAPGPVVAAVDDGRVTLELILDGVHVHPRVAAMLFAAAPGRIALITDAMAAAGADDGEYRLGSLDVTVADGTATLSGTETIAGSTLTQDAALRLAIDQVGLPPAHAVAALTLTPAAALGLERTLGLVEPGFAADLVAWTPGWTVERVWAAGSPIVP
ncbi:N-acetylglucosamine 6-phosphate deacetylase [Frondihabitans sp. PhB188]|uniref:N-acetylglucosamine-6-phosphate deacetylase n=1 Tax=Frondihabitans sp. PhB188 TaxID=2485200 RepID=UPI000F4AE039|nr:N-acetylglucosamine-6-phosphate deacetylase [Frondihabitans sp. PhB188]ROQ37498.1 N-acetylglucosamine 6-phosphate deacetylase [Frondihabitans sp. PhB188]